MCPKATLLPFSGLQTKATGLRKVHLDLSPNCYPNSQKHLKKPDIIQLILTT